MKLRIDLEKEYGIVLEGGGARGAYQIGVWKALREAGVKIRGVAGTSVGALNGALICMDDLEKAEEIWGNMTYSTVFRVDDPMIAKLKKFGVRSMKMTDAAAEFKRLFSDRGLDIAPLKKLLEETVDEERIRRSPRDFCAASFSVTDRKEEDFDVKEAPPGTMKDMMMASAYFPGFKQKDRRKDVSGRRQCQQCPGRSSDGPGVQRYHRDPPLRDRRGPEKVYGYPGGRNDP